MLQPFQLQRSFQIFQDQIFRPDLCFAEPEGPLGFVTKHEILFGYLLVLIKSQGSILTTLGLPYQFGGLHPHLGFTFNFSEISENSFFKKLRLRREHAHHHIFRRTVCPWPTWGAPNGFRLQHVLRCAPTWPPFRISYRHLAESCRWRFAGAWAAWHK